MKLHFLLLIASILACVDALSLKEDFRLLTSLVQESSTIVSDAATRGIKQGGTKIINPDVIKSDDADAHKMRFHSLGHYKVLIVFCVVLVIVCIITIVYNHKSKGSEA